MFKKNQQQSTRQKAGLPLLTIALAACITISQKASIAAPSHSQLIQAHQQEISEINAHLYQRTLVSSFVQKSGSKESRGKLYVDRSKRYFVIDYQTGDLPITVYSLASKNFYLDKETGEKVHLPAENLMAKAMVMQKIDNGQFLFQSIKSAPESIEIKFNFAKDPSEGLITILFDRKKQQLLSLTIKSPEEKEVVVTLTEYQSGIKIDNKVFESGMTFKDE